MEHQSGEVSTLTGKQDGELVFWLPVIQQYSTGIVVVSPLGKDLSDCKNFSGLPADDNQAAAILENLPYSELFPRADLILLRKLTIEPSPEIQGHGIWQEDEFRSFQLNLENVDYGSADNEFGVKFSKNQKRKLKGLRLFGDLNVVKASGKDRQKFFDFLVETKAGQLEAQGGGNRFKDAAFVEFLRSVFVEGAEEEFHLYGLSIDDELVCVVAIICKRLDLI